MRQWIFVVLLAGWLAACNSVDAPSDTAPPPDDNGEPPAPPPPDDDDDDDDNGDPPGPGPGPNDPPVVDAGAPQQARSGDTVTLSGSAEDPDGEVVSVQWSQVGDGPAVALQAADTLTASFVAPEVDDDVTLRFRLTATDDGGKSASAETEVLVRPLPDDPTAPVARAGQNQNAEGGALVELDGTASSGEALAFSWEQVEGEPQVALEDADTAVAQFVAPSLDASTVLTFRLTVTDSEGRSDSDLTRVTVKPVLPKAAAGADRIVDAGAEVTLDGSGSRTPQGELVDWQWEQRSGVSVDLEATDDPAIVRFTAPTAIAEVEELVFRLTVTDDRGLSASDELTVTVLPVNLCDDTSLCVGAAKTRITPDQRYIDGVEEARFGVGTREQKFFLGGFGLDPTQNFPDPFPQTPVLGEPPADTQVYTNAHGHEEHTWIRAMVVSERLEDGSDKQVAFVIVDAIGAGNVISNHLKAAVSAATGIAENDIVFGQTHTHAGADLQGLWGGVPQDWIEEQLYPAAVEAVWKAQQGMCPAELTIAQGDVPELNRYRRGDTGLDQEADPIMSLMQATCTAGPAEGRIKASLLQYNAHPVGIGTGVEPRAPHADYILGAVEWLEDADRERGGGVALYYNGPIAEAATSGSRPGCSFPQDGSFGTVRCRGEGMAERALAFTPRTLAPTLESRHETVVLPVTNPAFLAAGVLGSFNRYYDFLMLPVADIPVVGGALAAAMTDLPQLTPTAETPVSRISIGGPGGLEIVTIPGEATNTFGKYIRSLAAQTNPGAEVMLLGLTQQSFGYIIPENEFLIGEVLVLNDPYEELVSLGPLTAPLLRLQGYNPLFGVAPQSPDNLPPWLSACADTEDPNCIVIETARRLNHIQHMYEEACLDAGMPAEFCGLLNPNTPLAQPCLDAGLPRAMCALLGNIDDGGDESAMPHASCARQEHLDGNRSYQVLLDSASGQRISFQVLEPTALDCNRVAEGAHPLVLQGHGFGGSRSTSGFGSLRNAGFTVISIDQRGFGDSSGTVRVMDPDFEGRDLVQILDWAEQNLDYLAWRDRSQAGEPFVARPAAAESMPDGANLVVGAIGGSYGGGYQLLLLAVDEKNRLDAIVPDIAWHDLRYSLNPGDTIKTAWDLLLVVGGEAGSLAPGLDNQDLPLDRGLDPFIRETLVRGLATNEFPRDALTWFNYHSLGYWCASQGLPAMPYAAAEWNPLDLNQNVTGLLLEGDIPAIGSLPRALPPVDALITQGMRDTLFNFNDAWWNFQCLSALGGDVHLYTHQSGHILPAIQVGGGPQACGNTNLSSGGSFIVNWLRHKLQGQGNGPAMDEVCLSLDAGDAVRMPASSLLAPGGDEVGYTRFELGAAVVPNGLVAQALLLEGPTVVELAEVTAEAGALLAGIGRATVTLSSIPGLQDIACDQVVIPTLRTACDAITFVGFGVQRAGSGDWELIDEQIQPLRGLGTHEVDLVGVGARLQQGDRLALLLYGYHPQYPLSFSRDPSLPFVQLSGDFDVPLYGLVNGQPSAAVAEQSVLPLVEPPGLQLCVPLLGTCVSDLPLLGGIVQGLLDSLHGAQLSATLIDGCYDNDPTPEALPACKVADTVIQGFASFCRQLSGLSGDALRNEVCSLLSGRDINERVIGAFERSWEARAIRLQNKLGFSLPLVHTQVLATHNSFNATEENFPPTLSGLDPNQFYGVVDQMRMGVRGIELDIHWMPSPAGTPESGFRAPIVCHGNVNHFGCTLEKPLDEELRPLRAWLDANPEAVVIIDVQDELSEAIDDVTVSFDMAAAMFDEVLGDLIYRPAEHGAGCDDNAPVGDPTSWLNVTRTQMLAGGRQVLMYAGSCGDGNSEAWASLFHRKRGSNHTQSAPDHYEDYAYPACQASNGRFSSNERDTRWTRFYEDGTLVGAAIAGSPGLRIESALHEMARCGVNMPSMDFIAPEDGHVAAWIWSWAPEEPPRLPGRNCAYQNADGRFVAGDCLAPRASACVADDDPADWRVIQPVAAWGAATCPDGYAFGTPGSGYFNELLREAKADAGVDEVWLNYRRDATQPARWLTP